MEGGTGQLYKESRRVRAWVYVTVLLVNVFVFICIGTAYVSYTKNYRQKLFDENINNVENLNSAFANAAYTYVRSMGVKIDDILNFIEANGLSAEETIRYLGEANTDPDRQIQLILSGSYGETGKLSYGDFSGVSVRTLRKDGGGRKVITRRITYGSAYYDIRSAFTEFGVGHRRGTGFALEFTDPDTKRKSFAVYRQTVLKDSAGRKHLYTILLAVNSQNAMRALNMQDKYKGQSTVLVNGDGGYIIKNSDYRNVNFYDYIVNYNDLTLDRRALIQSEVSDAVKSGKRSTNLFSKNHKGDACVFSVAAMNNGWYCVTCVPVSSFSLDDDSVNYSLIILLLFMALFAFDGVSIYYIGQIMNYNVTVAELATAAANEASRAKSRFLSTMSHELRTPLNAIIGFASLSGDSIDDPPVLRNYLRKIEISSKLLLQLISDILDVSAIESSKMKINNAEFDISKLITSLSALYYDQCASKGVEFSVVLRDIHSETLIGDPVRVNQVLLNFLSNAVKFTPSGGRVTLSILAVKREEKEVTLRFEIADTGCGISDELKTRLFMPFERADGDAARRYSGSGLGLSIAKSLSELMNGRVGVESREGAGSCFWVELPFASPAVERRSGFSPITNLRIAAAVTNPEERGYIDQILTNIGAPHSMTGSAGEALELLREARGGENPYSLCILDWKMPDLNAADASRDIRAEFGGRTPRIMVLAYDIAEAKQLCTAAGADLIFGKPVFSSALYNALEEITASRPREIPEAEPIRGFGGKRVLLVEDNRMNVEVAKLILKKFGLDVETAEDGKVSCELFTASEPGYYDAILMDVQMPVMNGYQATQAIRASSHPDAKTIPILAMTADAFAEDVARAKAAGMNEHISKPIEPGVLHDILKKYLG